MNLAPPTQAEVYDGKLILPFALPRHGASLTPVMWQTGEPELMTRQPARNTPAGSVSNARRDGTKQATLRDLKRHDVADLRGPQRQTLECSNVCDADDDEDGAANSRESIQL